MWNKNLAIKSLIAGLLSCYIVVITFGCNRSKNEPVKSSAQNPSVPNTEVQNKSAENNTENEKKLNEELAELKARYEQLKALSEARKGFFENTAVKAGKFTDERIQEAVSLSLDAIHEIKLFIAYCQELKTQMDEYNGAKINTIIATANSIVEKEKEGLVALVEMTDEGAKFASKNIETAYNATLSGLIEATKTIEFLPQGFVISGSQSIDSIKKCGNDCIELAEQTLEQTEQFVNQKTEEAKELLQKIAHMSVVGYNNYARESLDVMRSTVYRIVDGYEATLEAIEKSKKQIESLPENVKIETGKKLQDLSQGALIMKEAIKSSVASNYDKITQPIAQPLVEAEKGMGQVTTDSYLQEAKEMYLDPVSNKAKQLIDWTSDSWHSGLQWFTQKLESSKTDKPKK